MSTQPTLPPPYDRALSRAVAFAESRYAPWAILAAGSVVRGEPDPRSDIDLYVLHEAGFRQRVQRYFEGIPVEMFVNPESAVWTYLDREREGGRLFTAGMLATGVPLKGGDDARLATLRTSARRLVGGAAAWDPGHLRGARYAAACLVDDALDLRAVDPEAGLRVLSSAVDQALTHWFKRQGRYIPRQKDRLGEVDASDRSLAQLFRGFWSDEPLDDRWSAALMIFDRVLGTRGFFEWESEPERVDDAEHGSSESGGDARSRLPE